MRTTYFFMVILTRAEIVADMYLSRVFASSFEKSSVKFKSRFKSVCLILLFSWWVDFFQQFLETYCFSLFPPTYLYSVWSSPGVSDLYFSFHTIFYFMFYAYPYRNVAYPATYPIFLFPYLFSPCLRQYGSVGDVQSRFLV